MKLYLYVLVLILMFNISYAQDFRSSEGLELELEISKQIKIVPESSNYRISNVKVIHQYFPKDSYNQKVISLDVDPEANIEDDVIEFDFDNPSWRTIDLNVKSTVKTNDNVMKIKNKIPFPISSLDEEFEEYTKPSKIIDSDDPKIIKTASEIVKGEDDLFKVVFLLADWTRNNVEYDLSTITAEASQKASWVLQYKEGVCDEITSLFIALLRTVGIPARFVSGISYTDSVLFDEPWGAHGWAEVYFPGIGWMPFDVTYEEFGYIDVGHIKLMDNIDSETSSIKYEWEGRNVDVEADDLVTNVNIKNDVKKKKSMVDLDVEVLHSEVTFGSNNLVIVDVENLNPYYIAVDVFLHNTEDIEIVGEHKKGVVLKPHETKKVFYIISVSGSLNERFRYTFPIMVSSSMNDSSKTSFISDIDGGYYSFDSVKTMMDSLAEEEKKVYSKKVELECEIDSSEFYIYEEANVDCNIKNVGNVPLNDLEFCFDESCEDFDLMIMQDNSLSYTISDVTPGKKTLMVKAFNDQINKNAFVDYNILDLPVITIENVKHPSSVRFKDEYSVSFVLNKHSASDPQNVKVKISYNDDSHDWKFDDLTTDKNFSIRMDGKRFKPGRNDVMVFVTYKDMNGKDYEVRKFFSISLVDVSIINRMEMFFIGVSEFFEGINIYYIVFIPGLIFLIIIFLVLRRK